MIGAAMAAMTGLVAPAFAATPTQSEARIIQRMPDWSGLSYADLYSPVFVPDHYGKWRKLSQRQIRRDRRRLAAGGCKTAFPRRK